GAALVIFGEEQMASKSGNLVSVSVLLPRGHTPLRVEYFQQEGEARPALDLRWSGPGLAGELSLVRRGGGREEAVAGNPSKPRLLEPGSKREARFTKTERGVEEKLIIKGQPLRYFRPSADPGSLSWTEREFDDSTDWLDGKNGIGYEDFPGDFKDLLETTIETEKGKHPHSLYLRIPFEVKDPKAYKGLALFIRYDDGFRASLNGSVVGQSGNAPFPLLWNSGSTKKRPEKDAVKAEQFPVSRGLKELVKGTNILAIHALNDGEKSKPNATNTGCASTDMLILAELVGLRKDSELPELPKTPVIREPSSHDFLIEESMKKGTVELTEGRFGEAYDFRGGSLDIGGDKNEVAIADRSYTVSLWFTNKPPDDRVRGLISAGGGSKEMAGWALWIEGDGSGLTFRVGDGSEGFDLPVKHDSLDDGEFHHVAVTIERDSREVCLFLDGERKDSRKVEALAGKTIESPSGLSIGRTSDPERFHLGKIDDVVLWSRALLPVEIKEIFESAEDGKSAGALLDAGSPE
ncbi:MAG: LamG domain-containing protein, partial [Roseibacillus sp.]|nr:LamG domain-containing protein [Roseibacillus sp.]